MLTTRCTAWRDGMEWNGSGTGAGTDGGTSLVICRTKVYPRKHMTLRLSAPLRVWDRSSFSSLDVCMEFWTDWKRGEKNNGGRMPCSDNLNMACPRRCLCILFINCPLTSTVHGSPHAECLPLPKNLFLEIFLWGQNLILSELSGEKNTTRILAQRGVYGASQQGAP